MDVLVLFLKAAGIGLVLAVPLGPIGLLCLRRSLIHGTAAGLVAGLGAATADAVYAAVAAFALGLAAPLIAQAEWVGALGGIALVGLGLRDLLDRGGAPRAPTLRGQLGAYAGTALLTLANPATILTFTAVIVGLNLVPDLASPSDGALFVVGVFAGSGLWWLVLSTAGGTLGGRLPPAALIWTRRIAGGVLIAFGLYALLW